MSWAESKEAGQKARPKAGQGCGKLVSVDWLTKSSPGLPVSSRSPRSKGNPPSLYNRSHICLPIFNYGFSKGAEPMLKTKEKNFECVHDFSWRTRRKKRDNLHLPNLGMIRCMKISTVSRCLRSR